LALLLAASAGLAKAGEPVVLQGSPLDPGFLQLMGAFGQPAAPATRRASADGIQVEYQFPDGTRLVVRHSDGAPGRSP
jgi:hypothetical protein